MRGKIGMSAVFIVLGLAAATAIAQKAPADRTTAPSQPVRDPVTHRLMYPPRERAPIFVRSAAAADGFTDPSRDREDSARDLLARFRESGVVRLAPEEKAAVILIEVIGREGKRAGGALMSLRSHVTVRLSAGQFSAEFTGNSGAMGTGYWGQAADDLVGQIEKWTIANHERLLDLMAKAEAKPQDEKKTPTRS